jgi:hypothetical protein
VLTFPFPLRFLFAAQPDALTQLLAVVQRFGSALNLNVHLNMLFLDGAYTFGGRGGAFHRARRPSNAELGQLLDTLSRRACLCAQLQTSQPDRAAPARGHGGLRSTRGTDELAVLHHISTPDELAPSYRGNHSGFYRADQAASLRSRYLLKAGNMCFILTIRRRFLCRLFG